jgi:hypothetical protein
MRAPRAYVGACSSLPHNRNMRRKDAPGQEAPLVISPRDLITFVKQVVLVVRRRLRRA